MTNQDTNKVELIHELEFQEFIDENLSMVQQQVVNQLTCIQSHLFKPIIKPWKEKHTNTHIT